MKQIIIIASLVLYTAHLNAQKKNDQEYRDHSKEVAAEIWGTKTPEFAVVQVPDAYNKESAVVIAKAVNVINTAKRKRAFIGGQVSDKLTYDNSFHMRVKINDKVALNEFSSIEYEKQLVRNIRAGWTKMYDQLYTFVGAKVIKPGGQEIIVNGDEEILTLNKNKEKEGKLAISGLQVGDILDYYVKQEVITQMGDQIQGPYTYFLNSDYPIMSFKLHMELDERAGGIYVSANGAPKPVITKNDDGPVVDLVLKNLTKSTDSKWILPMRQLPYVSIEYRVLFDKQADKSSDFNRGEVNPAEGWETFFTKLKKEYTTAFNASFMRPAPAYWDKAKDFFGGKRELRETPPDSLVKVLYNQMLKFAAGQAKTMDEFKQKLDGFSVFDFSIALDRSDLQHDFLFVSPHYGPSKDNILIGGNSLVPLFHLKGDKDIWIDLERSTFFSNKIPYWLEGEDAQGFSIKDGWKEVSYKLPVSSAADNIILENLEVSQQPANMLSLDFKRKTTLTGNYMEGTINDLVTVEDWRESLNSTMIKKKETASQKSANPEADVKQKKAFDTEIDAWFDQEPKEMTNARINSLTTNAFIYSSDFTMDNWVKKAGNNYIIEAGRMIGSISKVEGDQRSRVLDIHIPFARTLQYNFTIAVPAGYTVKGLENFIKDIKNETGEFTASAVLNGDKVSFTVKRVLVKPFQPAANWPKILTLLDATYDYSQQKLLFEKNK